MPPCREEEVFFEPAIGNRAGHSGEEARKRAKTVQKEGQGDEDIPGWYGGSDVLGVKTEELRKWAKHAYIHPPVPEMI
jgi:hypothetical protein